MADKEIHIHKNGKVTPDPCHLSKSQGEGVLWITDADVDGDVDIDFPANSPFAKSQFAVKSRGGSEPSGAVKTSAKEGETYSYDVTIKEQTQTHAADPDIKIDQ